MSQTKPSIAEIIAHLRQIANRIGLGRLTLGGVLFVVCLPIMRWLFLAASLLYNISALQSLADNPSPTAIVSAGSAIQGTRNNITALRNEAGFLLKAGPALKWVPVIGSDLVYADGLLDMATEMAIAADETYQGLRPLMNAALGDANHPTPSQVLDFLTAAQSNFTDAQSAISAANIARSNIPLNDLSPLGQRLVSKSDRVLLLMRQGIAAINVAPALLGSDGTKTYLMLIQNQDELRPTGGFLSAAGLLTIDRGDILSMNIQDSYAVGDYVIPEVPGPLAKYMAAEGLVFRDSNWSPDFPTSAQLAIRLYQGDHPEAQIDGVIALDQSAISILLKATGPIVVEGVPELISSDNLISYMRSAWSTEPEQGVNYEWWLHRKDFIQNMAGGLIKQLAGAPWAAIGQAGTQALRERHIQVWLKDESAAKILADQGWDGAIKPPPAGDFLFVDEANVGFNKVNAAIQKQIDYAVDLTNLSNPTANVRVINFNPAKGQTPCVHDPNYGSGQYEELINRCYWNYIRVYALGTARLTNASLHDIPADWILTGKPVLGTVDILPGENGTVSFGSLMVVPFSSTDSMYFEYSLPPQAVLTPTGNATTYSVHIQKQSGVEAIWMTITIALPPTAQIVISPIEGDWQANSWSYQFSLKEDTDFSLTFTP
jgi:hypothetical protein